MDAKSLAARVRALRIAKGMGPGEAADAAGLSRSALYLIEAGRVSSPRIKTLAKLSAWLGVPMAEPAAYPGVPMAEPAAYPVAFPLRFDTPGACAEYLDSIGARGEYLD